MMILANTITASDMIGFVGIFLNLFIGIFEAWLLGKLFKANKRRLKLRMIAANYTSYFVGFFLFPFTLLFSRYIDLYTVKIFVWVSFLVFLTVTILIEWPFVVGAFREKPKPVRSALRATAVVQVISYALLFPFFMVGRYDFLRSTHVVKQLDFVQRQNASVYYFSSQDGFIYRLDMENLKSDLVSNAVRSESRYDRLYLDQTKDGPQWDLYANTRPGKYVASSEKTILVAKGVTDQPSEREGYPPVSLQSNVTDLRSEPKTPLRMRCFPFLGQGLSITDEQGEDICTAFNTPFITWDSKAATMLPGDQMVFELERQVCILDYTTHKIGLLAKGWGLLTCINPKAKE